jgi:hypothetical protein
MAVLDAKQSAPPHRGLLMHGHRQDPTCRRRVISRGDGMTALPGLEPLNA